MECLLEEEVEGVSLTSWSGSSEMLLISWNEKSSGGPVGNCTRWPPSAAVTGRASALMAGFGISPCQHQLAATLSDKAAEKSALEERCLVD